jgi:hypothetical protein
MQLFDVCTKRIYEADGEKKVRWYRAGFMKITDKGSTYLRLFSQPEVDLHVFKREETLPEIQRED